MRTRPVPLVLLILLTADVSDAQIGTFPFGRRQSAMIASPAVSPVAAYPPANAVQPVAAYPPANAAQPVAAYPPANAAQPVAGYPPANASYAVGEPYSQVARQGQGSSFFSVPSLPAPSFGSLLSGFSHQNSPGASYAEIPGRQANGYYIAAEPTTYAQGWTPPAAQPPVYPSQPVAAYPQHAATSGPVYRYPAFAGSRPPWPGGATVFQPAPVAGPPAGAYAVATPPAAARPVRPYVNASPVSYGPEGQNASQPAADSPGQQPEYAAAAATPMQAGCAPMYYPCQPQRPPVYTTTGADVIGMRRSHGNSAPLVLDNTSCCIGIGDLDFEHELGLRASIVRDRCCGWGWELAYMGVPEWKGSVEAYGNLSLEGPGFQLQVLPGRFVVEYESSFHNVELNWRWTDYCRWSWFTGFRYMRFNDYVTVSELETPFINALDMDVTNDLYGFQLGVDYVLYNRCGPLRVELGGKIGMYANDAQQLTQSSFIRPPLSCQDQVFAYSAEAEIRVVYQIFDCLEIRAGYQFLGVGGMALAGDQLYASDYSTGYSSIHYNHLLLDGGHLGFRYCW